MEIFNNGGFLFSSIDETFNFNHDLAIRRFCPARIQQENEELEEALSFYDEVPQFSPSDDIEDVTTEVDYDFVDSFINMEDDDDKKLEDPSSSKIEICSIGVEEDQDQDHQVDEEAPILSDNGVSSSGVCVGTNVDQGLQLVHVLLACAEAVGCRDTTLAESMLSKIWTTVSPYGDSLQRVSYCFALGLKSRLDLLHNNVNPNGMIFPNGVFENSISREEKLEAFHLLYQTTPYLAFGFMAANEAILDASSKETLHVIDLGMDHTLQWPSLFRSLASRPEGPRKIRITGLVDEKNLTELNNKMELLVQEAISLGVELDFRLVSEPVKTSTLTQEKLDIKEGETMIVNSIMHLHKYVKESRGSLKAILQAIKKLNPTLVTMVEQDANHNGPFFLGRFLESLHYYSAIFDSLEARLPRNSLQRLNIERYHLAEEIRNIVAYEGSDRVERHERADQWRRQFGRAGFQVVGFKCLSQARMMLSVYGCDGYTLGCEKGCLLLGWKGRPIMLASAWQLHNNVPNS